MTQEILRALRLAHPKYGSFGGPWGLCRTPGSAASR